MKNQVIRIRALGMLIIILICCETGFGQLKANFTSSVVAGCAPLFVQFTDASVGSPTSWYWDFGNGSVSTQQSPGAIYSTPGIYKVKLIVQNIFLEDSTIQYDTVYAKPSVDFGFSPNSGCTPFPVKFTDASSGNGATLTQWDWDFGDGQLDSSQNPTHVYNTVGNFGVTLTVTNNLGCSSILQKPGIITADGVINAGFQYSYKNVCSPPTAVTFTNSTSSNVPISYQWNFGNGDTSTAQNPVYTYKSNGKFTIQLIATTISGCADTVSQNISIGTVTPNFGMAVGACANKKAVFSDSSLPTPISVTWNFGDGTTAKGSVVSHAYTAAGTYPVTLVANFGACTDSVTKNFTVTSKPTAGFTASGGNKDGCQLPGIVLLQNTSTNATSYIWNFGNGQKSTLTSPTAVYPKAGFYDVTLIAINSNGCNDTIVAPKFVQLGPPRIDSLIAGPFRGCAPIDVTLNAAISSGDPVTNYSWDFGDGSAISTVPSPTHTYAVASTYNVKLKVATATGCVDSTTFSKVVITGNKPVAKFEATPTSGCASDSVQFTDESTGSITSRTWDFGDKGKSTVQNPLYKYTDTGFFSVTLTVLSNGCSDILKLPNYIYINGPIAKFAVSKPCGQNLTRNFTDNSIGATTRLWDFGDGQTSASKSPSNTYAKPGTYFVTLTVTNGSCSDVKKDTISIVNPDPSFTYSPQTTSICKNSVVQFSVQNFDATSFSYFYWVFGDATTATTPLKTPTTSHGYKSSGIFTPYVVLKYSTGCSDTLKNTALKFTVLGPTASFTNTTGACLHSSINFTDKSSQDSTFNIKKWIWSYGDGKTDTLSGPPFFHVYDSAGIFKVKLKVIDSYGCFDSIIKNNADTITQPIASFSLPDSTRCLGSNINFSDSSRGLSLSYLWSFGDGTTSTDIAPNHQYTNPGAYTVSLTVTDKFNCTATKIRTTYAIISNPKAQFTIGDTFAVCPPLVIRPQSNSLNSTFLIWDFGDNNTSNVPNPVHTYTGGGTYLLRLIAQGHGSCYDTATKHIVLLGPAGTLSYSPLTLCKGDTVRFAVTGHSIYTYAWDFGNNTDASKKDSIIYNSYTKPGYYFPKLVIGDATGACFVTLQNTADTIKVGGVTADFTYQAPAGCDSTLVSFTNNSAILFDTLESIAWNFGDGITSSSLNPTHYYPSTGTEKVLVNVTTSFGCKSSDTVNVQVTVHQVPVVKASIPSYVCVNQPASFSATNNSVPPGTVTWLWQFGDGDTSTQNNPSYTYKTGTAYTAIVKATNEFGCTDSATSNITIKQSPVINAGADTVICLGQTVLLKPTGANTYAWAKNTTLTCDSCTSPLATPDSTMNYYVTGTDASGCFALDSVRVTVKRPFTLQLPNNDTLCIGSSIQLMASGAEEYTWQQQPGLSNYNIPNPVANPSTTTTYTVTATDSKKCFTQTSSTTVNVYALPTVNITQTGVTIEAGSSFMPTTVTSADVTRYQWSPVFGLTCSNCAEPVMSPKQTTVYIDTVFNQYGCAGYDSITITVLCNNNSLFIPNTFAPKGNPNNRYFYPRGLGLYSIKSMRIFNRWGLPVFEKLNFVANDQSSGWNGTYKGADLPTDVYVYIIEVICTNGTILTTKGDVTLLR